MIYSKSIPSELIEFANVKEMQRLKDISMSCGLVYTKSKIYRKHYGNKFEHSFDCALIVWNFTGDLKQSVAALYHDISTPVFAHTIDFMNEDHLTQESTEGLTCDIIKNSEEINELLTKYGLKLEEVCDYHMYPIADNDSPKLSSDRLQYSLKNFSQFSLCEEDKIQEMYNDLHVEINEFGEEEICFRNSISATEFQKLSLECSKIYANDFARAAMHYLSKIVRSSIEKGILKYEDLYNFSEKEIIKIISDSELGYKWRIFTYFKDSYICKSEEDAAKIQCKLRYIDPFIPSCKCRVSSIVEDSKTKIESYKNLKFDYNVHLY